MNPYEIFFTFSIDASKESIDNCCDKLKKMVKKNGGEVVSLEEWGRRKLSQPIKGRQELYYYCFTFTAPGDFIAELENNIKITADIISHITIRLKDKVIDLRREQIKKEKMGEKDGRPTDVGTEQGSSSGEIDQGS